MEENKNLEKTDISDVIIIKKLLKHNNKFYITDENEIIKNDKILYRIGTHKDYPYMFGECLGFDTSGFVMIHDDMSIHKSLCTKLIETMSYTNRKKLIQLRTKLEFYKKLGNKLDKVLNAELEIEDWSDEVYNKISSLENEIDDLKIEMDFSDEEWSEDEGA